MADFPSTTSAYGVWSLREQRDAVRGDNWPVVVTDEYFANVSLLLHGDGTDGSTTFIDSSSNNFTVTANGNAQIDTTTVKYGTGSMEFDGTGDYLTIIDDGNFDFGTGDFTVEAWINVSTFVQDAGTILGGLGPTNGDWMIVARSPTQLSIGRNHLAWDATTSGFTMSTGTWYHTAVCRSSGTLRIFIDGVAYFTGSNTRSYNIANTYLAVGARQVTFNAFGAGEYFNGYIDDLRITKGVARYTANFTPPTAPFPDQ